MSTVVDLAGNNPVALDPANTRTDKVSSVEFRGASQSLAIAATATQSAPFGNLARFLRIAPDTQNIWYDIGSIADVDATDATRRRFLANGAVEAVPIRPGQVFEVIETAVVADGLVTITEDK